MIHYYEDVLQVLEDAVASIDETVYEQLLADCERTIRGGGKLIASGLGKNVPICEKFVGTLNSMGIDARFLHTNTAIHGDLGIVVNDRKPSGLDMAVAVNLDRDVFSLPAIRREL